LLSRLFVISSVIAEFSQFRFDSRQGGLLRDGEVPFRQALFNAF